MLHSSAYVYVWTSRHALQCVAVCCSVLQCVECAAVCCSVLQCAAVCCNILKFYLKDTIIERHTSAYVYVSTSQSVLQCVAVCCSVFLFSLLGTRL